MTMEASPRRLRLAFFASGNGSGMHAVASAILRAELQAELCLVISNRADCRAIAWARAGGVETLISQDASTDGNQDRCLEVLDRHQVDLIILTGYLRKVGQAVLDRYAPRILNVHPSLLPKFGGKGMYGDRVHRAVIEAGELITGASIHIVDSDYDTGSVIAQSKIGVGEASTVESLADRVKDLEGKLLVNTLRRIGSGKLQLNIGDAHGGGPHFVNLSRS